VKSILFSLFTRINRFSQRRSPDSLHVFPIKNLAWAADFL
jgi:hypothetical protein